MFSGLLTLISFSLRRLRPQKKFQVPFKRWSIVKGDKVVMRAGKDKGKLGIVLRVFRKSNTIIVHGVRVTTKIIINKNGKIEDERGDKTKKTQSNPVHVSNVGLYDKSIKKPVRIRYAFHPQTGEKFRISKKTGIILKKPVLKSVRRQAKGKKRQLGVKDTEIVNAHKITYKGEDFQQIKRQFEQFISEKQAKQKYLVFNE